MIDGFLHMRKGSETKNEVNHDKWSGSRIEIISDNAIWEKVIGFDNA